MPRKSNVFISGTEENTFFSLKNSKTGLFLQYRGGGKGIWAKEPYNRPLPRFREWLKEMSIYAPGELEDCEVVEILWKRKTTQEFVPTNTTIEFELECLSFEILQGTHEST